MIKSYFNIKGQFNSLLFLCSALLVFFTSSVKSQESDKFIEYKGLVISKGSNNPLPFVNLVVEGTNIATVTNSEGNFSLKIDEALPSAKVTFTYPGYQKLIIIMADLSNENSVISLSPQTYELDEINISRPKNALYLVQQVFDNIDKNYADQDNFMTAFYRETINKRNRSASLAEAVVTIQKKPYASYETDLISIYKARKSTNYDRLDTVAIKLQGGPLNALYADLVKYPKYFITPQSLSNYDFSFGEPLINDGSMVYIVNFKQKSTINEPLYYGKLFIDAQSNALTNAIYNLNVEDRNAAAALFVKKKPNRVKVYPTEISYRIDYRNKDGKWYYSYSNVQLEFVVNWKRKLFNSKYRISSEMLITDWETELMSDGIDRKSKFKQNAVLADEVSGFADPEFWGAYNVIEPEKSIQQAIDKIQKQIKRD